VGAWTDEDGLTSLHLACWKGHASIIRLLLDRGAHVGVRTAKGETALHLAGMHGKEPVVRLLLDKGADMGARTDEGSRTALQLASDKGHAAVARLLRGAAGAV
jgi:ankyrin repeat protein